MLDNEETSLAAGANVKLSIMKDVEVQRLVDLLGRFIFGSFALLASVGFAVIFVVLAHMKPVNILQGLLQSILMNCCAVVSMFTILAMIKWWSTAKWVDRWLDSLMLKAGVILIGLAVTLITIGFVK